MCYKLSGKREKRESVCLSDWLTDWLIDARCRISHISWFHSFNNPPFPAPPCLKYQLYFALKLHVYTPSKFLKSVPESIPCPLNYLRSLIHLLRWEKSCLFHLPLGQLSWLFLNMFFVNFTISLSSAKENHVKILVEIILNSPISFGNFTQPLSKICKNEIKSNVSAKMWSQSYLRENALGPEPKPCLSRTSVRVLPVRALLTLFGVSSSSVSCLNVTEIFSFWFMRTNWSHTFIYFF